MLRLFDPLQTLEHCPRSLNQLLLPPGRSCPIRFTSTQTDRQTDRSLHHSLTPAGMCTCPLFVRQTPGLWATGAGGTCTHLSHTWMCPSECQARPARHPRRRKEAIPAVSEGEITAGSSDGISRGLGTRSGRRSWHTEIARHVQESLWHGGGRTVSDGDPPGTFNPSMHTCPGN